MLFDLAIVGGTIVDPASGRSKLADLAVRDGKIAAIDSSIAPDAALRVIEAVGRYVVPGFVDAHTHIYSGSTYWGIEHEALGWRSGVTTFVDAGSAGVYNFAGLRRYIIEPSTFRIHAFLNIASTGLTGPSRELWHLTDWNPDSCAETAATARGSIVGIKVRADRNVLGDQGLMPVRAAIEVASRCGLPVMVHIGTAPPLVDAVLDLLRPGDIVTHCFTPATMRLVGEDGGLRSSARSARERGVLFDVGHGVGGFSFAIAERLMANGLVPDLISSDAHRLSVASPMVDLPTCLTKLLGLGMPFDDVITAATTRPAAAIGIDRDVGSLAIGRQADIAVISREPGHFTLVDSTGDERTMGERITVVATVLAGKLPGELRPGRSGSASTVASDGRQLNNPSP